MNYKVLAIFKDGQQKVFDGADEYGILADCKCFFIKKNDRYAAFIPGDVIVYFGLFEEWENG